jgi:hypothetical protein
VWLTDEQRRAGMATTKFVFSGLGVRFPRGALSDLGFPRHPSRRTHRVCSVCARPSRRPSAASAASAATVGYTDEYVSAVIVELLWPSCS